MKHKENGYAQHMAPAGYGQLLAVGMLVLFFITQNIGIVFFQLRNANIANAGVTILGYISGVLLAALAVDILQRRVNSGEGGKAVLARLLIFLMVLLPGVFCLLSFQRMPYPGLLPVNMFQFFLWGLTLPPALRYFFQRVAPERQALFFGIAMGAGHLCWALLMPLVGGLSPEALTLVGSLENRFLPFLNLARVVTNTAFAFLIWKLSALEMSRSTERRPGASPAVEKPSCRALACLLLPVLLCFMLNGWLGYQFFGRLLAKGANLEYAHLALVAFFPLTGFLLYQKGTALLLPLLAATVLCFAAAPLVFSLPPLQGALQVLYLACVAGTQVLYFAGVLVASHFAYKTRWPAVVLSLPWLMVLGAIAGHALGGRVLPLLDLPALAVTGGLAVVCAASALLLRRVFPLPPLPEGPVYVARADKLTAFAEAFKLSPRETEVLEGVIQQHTPEQIQQALGISQSTVRFHLTGLFRKTGKANRRQVSLFFDVWS